MGVNDLWQLLSPVGRRISIETLEGKTLAIDVSIWITQFIKAMRDEDGRMMKNAHILGTLRRILKLLYHRIRPLFVFDGATPALKLKTVSARRKTRDVQEVSKRIAAQRILLTQLRQHSLKVDNESRDCDISSFAPSFVHMNQHKQLNITDDSSNTIDINTEDSMVSSTSIVAVEDAIISDDDVQWVSSGYESLKKSKKMVNFDDNIDDDSDNEGQDNQQNWNIPEDYNDINVESLSAMPSHIRKSLIEEARRRERTRSRATYLPVATNPDLYSQTQLANFLNTSKLNSRFALVQAAVDSQTIGKSIASEGGRKYTLSAAPPQQQQQIMQKATAVSSHAAVDYQPGANNTNTEFVLNLADDDSDNDSDNNSGGGRHGDFGVSAAVDDEMDWLNSVDATEESVSEKGIDYDDEWSPDKHTADLAWLQSGATASSSSTTITDKMKSSTSSELKHKSRTVITIDDDDADDADALEHIISTSTTTATAAVNTTKDTVTDSKSTVLSESQLGSKNIATPNVDNSSQQQQQQQDVIPNFYVNLHSNLEGDSEGDDQDDFGDVEWLSDVEEEEGDRCGDDMPVVNTSDEVIDVTDSADVLVEKHDVFDSIQGEHEYEETKDFLTADSTTAQWSLSSSSGQSRGNVNSTVDMDNSALIRAVNTASNMADWAGRAVRSALRQHINATGTNQLNTEVSLTSESVLSVPGDVVVTTTDSGVWDPDLSYRDNSTLASSTTNITALQQWQHHPPQFSNQQEALAWERDEERSARRTLSAAQRDTEGLTEEMKSDVIELLRAFDLPFIVAPYEAEAQCSVLEELGLVDGVVTEDSDAFLFGAQSVYRHIFSDKKFVEVYQSSDIQHELGLTREDLIGMAYFLGCDYTEGVNGVGIVNAMEIVEAFSMRIETGGPMAGLQRFKEWLDGFDAVSAVTSQYAEKKQKKRDKGGVAKKSSCGSEGDEDEYESVKGGNECVDVETDLTEQARRNAEEKLMAFQSKHQHGRSKWTVPPSFPNDQVANAFLHPAANRDTEQFCWTVPDLVRIRKYCSDVLRWTSTEMNANIDPVVAKYCERLYQTRIDSHFLAYKDDTRFAKIASERLRTAVVQITGKRTNLSLSGKRTTKPRKKKSEQKDV